MLQHRAPAKADMRFKQTRYFCEIPPIQRKKRMNERIPRQAYIPPFPTYIVISDIWYLTMSVFRDRLKLKLK